MFDPKPGMSSVAAAAKRTGRIEWLVIVGSTTSTNVRLRDATEGKCGLDWRFA